MSISVSQYTGVRFGAIAAVALTAVSMLTFVAEATVPPPIIHLGFDEGPASTTTIGESAGVTIAGGTLTYRNGSGTAVALGGGAGVTGSPGDYSFDNTASVFNANSSRLDSSLDSAFDSLTSLTISGWFKKDSSSAQTISPVRIVSTAASTAANAQGFQLQWDVSANGDLAMRLETRIAGAVVSATNSMFAYTGPDSPWTFFALTLDCTQATDNVKFYVGDLDTPVSLVSTHSQSFLGLTAGNQHIGNGGALVIGNRGNSSPNRAFDAFMDEFNIWGTTSGNAGVLSIEQLEDVRLLVVPEPSALAIGLAGGFGLLLSRRRGRR